MLVQTRMVIGKLLRNEDQQLILAEIAKNRSITVPQLAKAVDISERKIYQNLLALKGKGLLVRKGAKRNGYWEIKQR